MSNQPDPIIEEIHETRRKLAERFQFDVRRITLDAKCRQLQEGRPVYDPELENQDSSPAKDGTKRSNL